MTLDINFHACMHAKPQQKLSHTKKIKPIVK